MPKNRFKILFLISVFTVYGLGCMAFNCLKDLIGSFRTAAVNHDL